MERVASAARGRPDAKTRTLIRWIDDHLCPDRARWNVRRVLIFTENVIGTKRYLREMLEQAIAGTDLADERIETIDGQTAGANRKEIQRRFNADPADDPLRILIATDAAREGLNFQAHCTDLFHFDLPWNPGRIEQRNGRIDRKLQPAPEVRCHYFVLPQRAEDRVLEVLVTKTQTIKRELGSLSKVIDDDIERRLRGGIRHRDVQRLAREIEAADLDQEKKRVAAEELEAARERQEDLKEQIERCRGLLDRSRRWVDFEPEPFRAALSCSLELLGAEPLQEERAEGGSPGWTFPPLTGQTLADASWTATLDTLRVPRRRNQKLADWRREAPIRPVVFEDAGVLTDDTVHLHLEQRMAQRLLARFRAQGFVHPDPVPRLPGTGRRLDPAGDPVGPGVPVRPSRRTPARNPYAGRRALDRAVPTRGTAQGLRRGGRSANPPRSGVRAAGMRTPRVRPFTAVCSTPPPRTSRTCCRSSRSGPRWSPEPRPTRCAIVARVRARQLRVNLERQRQRVEAELGKHEAAQVQLSLEFNDEEKRQRQADVTAWRRRLSQFDRDLETEPSRIRQFYEVRAQRVEPVGLVYLWPDTG